MNREPLMQRVLGPAWNRLAPVIRAHYSITPETTEQITVQGHLRVDFPIFLTPLIKLIHLFGGLVDRPGESIETRVTKSSKPNQPELFWHRVLVYPDGKPKVFRSKMQFQGENEVIEYINKHLGMCLSISEQDGDLIYRSNGYVFTIGSHRLVIPDWLGLGHARIIEHALSESEFELEFRIHHPLIGNSFQYHGIFELVNDPKRS